MSRAAKALSDSARQSSDQPRAPAACPGWLATSHDERPPGSAT